MYSRSTYLDRIRPYINMPVIKVITGMRRVGKSYFLRQIENHLIVDLQVSSDKIIFIDKELVEFDFVQSYKELDSYVKNKLGQGKYYLFIDEVQEIKSWEKAVVSFLKSEQVEIFISGSNAHLLSSELATLITGRFVEFPIYPLSFREFIEFNNFTKENPEEAFAEYLKFGGLPAIQNLRQFETEALQYINAIYNTVLLKDIVQRFSVRNITILKNIAEFVFSNVGSIFSAKKIADYLKAQKVSLTVDTVQNYMKYLEDAYLVHKVRRFDIKGKRHMELYEKYYLNDIGIRNGVSGIRSGDIGHIIENIVFLELKFRGFTVNIGKIAEQEVDFIVTKAKQKFYIQVCYLLESAETLQREISALNNIADNYPKFLISMDKYKSSEDFDGIIHLNLFEFLLRDNQLI